MPTTTVTSDDHRALLDIADIIHSSKRIVIVTGAGISTNSGIPDFRSTHGLYNLVKARYPASISSNSISAGKDLFSSSLFADPTSTSIFYSFLAELRESVLQVKDTTLTHKFIRTLAESGRLLRCYTQNIDGLEGREGLATDLSLGKGGPVSKKKRKRSSLAGVPGEIGLGDGEGHGDILTAPKRGCQVVQLHGELDTLRCMHCQGTCRYDDEKVAALMEGRAPDCPSCLTKDYERRKAGKRGTRVGGLRPNIVLYGEEHPQGDTIGTITRADLTSRPDMMIIFGTSLKVHGLKRLVKEFAASIHSRAKKSPGEGILGEGDEGGVCGKRVQQPPRVVYVNNQPAANSVWKDVIDAWVDMDCDEFVTEMRRRRPAVWERQETLEAGFRRVLERKTVSDSGKAGKIVKAATALAGNARVKTKKGASSSKARTLSEESDKENSTLGRLTGKSTSRSARRLATTTPIKKGLLPASASLSNTMSAVNITTPKHKQTPLPTPPSSISKPKSNASRRSRYSSPSISPLTSLGSTPSPLRATAIECATSSRLQRSMAMAAAAIEGIEWIDNECKTQEEEEEEEKNREDHSPCKRRRSARRDSEAALVAALSTSKTRLQGEVRGSMIQAVVIHSPRAKSKKQILTGRVPNIITTRSKVV